MLRDRFDRTLTFIKRIFGIRARLAVLTLMLVGPLMADRIRTLENFRESEIARVGEELAAIAEGGARTQTNLTLAIETILRTTAFNYAATPAGGDRCAILKSNLLSATPWIGSLSIVTEDGFVICSTLAGLRSESLAGQPYLAEAIAKQSFIVSGILPNLGTDNPTLMAAFPMSSISATADDIVVASVNLSWVTRMIEKLGQHVGASGMIVDPDGIVVASTSGKDGLVGQSLDPATLRAVKNAAAVAPPPRKELTKYTSVNGVGRAAWVAPIVGTGGRMILTIDEAELSRDVDAHIRTAYIELFATCLFVLLGALFVSERLIIRPVLALAGVAKRFGRSDWSARVSRDGLPVEFLPLARALNEMATELDQRQREMLRDNDRLAVMATLDMLTGLANRRGLQSRLDFEWAKAEQTGEPLSLLMIDVDHFKAFNDTYGHPEGDACLARFGETLGTIALEVGGVGGRYGGEEFCLILPRTDPDRANRIGERVRTAIQDLAIPHAAAAAQRVTASIGVASATPTSFQSSRDLVEAADAALYSAKHRGRNRVMGASLDLISSPSLAMAD